MEKDEKAQRVVNARMRVTGVMIAAASGLCGLIAGLIFVNKDFGARIAVSFGIGAVTMFFVFAAFYYVFAIMQKRRLMLLAAEISTVCGGVVLMIILGCLWWIILAVAVCAAALILLSMFLVFTDKLVVETDDRKPGYKDWKTREAEKKAQAELDEKNGVKKPEEELPEIKSFKQ